MLDPISALTVATATAQFLDFSFKVIAHSEQIRRDGSTVRIADLKLVAKDFSHFSHNIEEHLLRIEPSVLLNTDEKALSTFVKDCQKLASELQDSLQTFTVQDRQSKWNSLRIALQTVLGKDKINYFENRLKDYRARLGLHLMKVLSHQLIKQQNNLNELEAGTHQIAEVLSVNRQHLSSKLQTQQEKQDAQFSDLERSASVRHEEIIGAILTLRDGRFHNIFPENNASGFSSACDPTTKRTVAIYHPKTYPAGSSFTLPPDLSTEQLSDIHSRLLKELRYQQMSYRRDAILPAHARTFRWIFSETTESGVPCEFVGWLRSGHGCFWINGKAGSGKSTLMKHIVDQTETYCLLREWASYYELFVGYFFFWRAGAELQRSQEGLLRSILFQLIKWKPDLVPEIFPMICDNTVNSNATSVLPSVAELKRALVIVISSFPILARCCIFIDGIDEYDGRYADLIEIFKLAQHSRTVKFVLSSRPIPECVYSFRNYKSIRLQDLTENDIKLYVYETLSSHDLMQRMDDRTPSSTNQLVQSITRKASGVFLWVVIVTRSIIDGLQSYDRLDDLLRRVKELPQELEDLYRHMMSAMKPLYRRQASVMLQLLRRAVKMQREFQMTLLQLSYAEEEDPRKGLSAKVEDISPQEEADRCEETEGRIRSRCCGLVEVETMGIALEEDRKVAFLHRTVIEFLNDERIWQVLLDWTKDAPPRIDEILLGSCLFEMKRKPPSTAEDMHKGRVGNNMRQCLKYARELEHAGSSATSYLDEVFAVMQHYQDTCQGMPESSIQQSKNFKRNESTDQDKPKGMWVNAELTPRFEGIFRAVDVLEPHLELALQRGLVRYVKESLISHREASKVATQLLFNFILSCVHLRYGFRYLGLESSCIGEIFRALFSLGVCPNRSLQEQINSPDWDKQWGTPRVTPWTAFCSSFAMAAAQSHDTKHEKSDLRLIHELIILFIRQGAGLKEKIPELGRPPSLALEIIEGYITPIINAKNYRFPLSDEAAAVQEVLRSYQNAEGPFRLLLENDEPRSYLLSELEGGDGIFGRTQTPEEGVRKHRPSLFGKLKRWRFGNE